MLGVRVDAVLRLEEADEVMLEWRVADVLRGS